MGFCKIFSETKPLVHIFVCLFGIASWIDINGLWVELPILVVNLPEGWTLPSYIIILSQIANVGPIIFVILVYLLPRKKLEIPASFIVIGVGVIACLLLSFFWKETTYVAGQNRATALLALNFLLATVDTTSSLAFLAFMASLKVQYMSFFFIGEGLSGMLPSLISLGQGAGSVVCVNGSQTKTTLINGTWLNDTTYSVYPMYEEPRFSVQVFFLILFGMMCLSMFSFLMLNFHPYCKREHVQKPSYTLGEEVLPNSQPKSEPLDWAENIEKGKVVQTEPSRYGSTASTKQLVSETKEPDVQGLTDNKISRKTFWFLMGLTGLINMQISSFLLSVQSYSSLPYGIDIFHLVATLTNIANPVACFVSLFLPTKCTPVITLLTLTGSVFSAYIVVMAAMSPTPPLVDHQAGGAVSVISWVCASFLLTYSKVSIAGVLRREGRKPLIWFGAFTQIGALTGAIVAYVMVNVYYLFESAAYC